MKTRRGIFSSPCICLTSHNYNIELQENMNLQGLRKTIYNTNSRMHVSINIEHRGSTIFIQGYYLILFEFYYVFTSFIFVDFTHNIRYNFWEKLTSRKLLVGAWCNVQFNLIFLIETFRPGSQNTSTILAYMLWASFTPFNNAWMAIDCT